MHYNPDIKGHSSTKGQTLEESETIKKMIDFGTEASLERKNNSKGLSWGEQI